MRLALAEYRSAVEAAQFEKALPKLPPVDHFITFNGHQFITIEGFAYNFQEVRGDAIATGYPESPKLSDGLTVQDSTLADGVQTLDGIHWASVTFVGMRVIYKGGEVELKNVRFVNCTFEFPESPNAAKLVDYAALLPSTPLTVE